MLGKEELCALSAKDVRDTKLIRRLRNRSAVVFAPLSQILARQTEDRLLNLSEKRKQTNKRQSDDSTQDTENTETQPLDETQPLEEFTQSDNEKGILPKHSRLIVDPTPTPTPITEQLPDEFTQPDIEKGTSAVFMHD